MFLAAASEYDQVGGDLLNHHHGDNGDNVSEGLGGGPHREQDGGESQPVPDYSVIPLVQVRENTSNTCTEIR